LLVTEDFDSLAAAGIDVTGVGFAVARQPLSPLVVMPISRAPARRISKGAAGARSSFTAIGEFYARNFS
jgi:hypothetical protein